jgi:hypothetical protein
MMYGDVKLRLPNPELALYSVQTLHVEIQAQPVNQRAPTRTASARVTTRHDPVWRDAEPEYEEPAHRSYEDWARRQPYSLNPWAYPEPNQPSYGYNQPSSSQYDPSGAGPSSSGNPRHSFDAYGTRTEPPVHDFEPGRRSEATGFYYTQQYHDEQVAFRQRTNNSLLQNQQNWENQRRWNDTTGQTLSAIREGQERSLSSLQQVMSFLQIPEDDE